MRLRGCCGVVGSLVRVDERAGKCKGKGGWGVAECVGERKGGVSKLVRLYPHLGRATRG